MAAVVEAVEEARGAEPAHRVEGVREAAVRPVEAGGTVAASLAGVEVAVDRVEPEAVVVGLVAAREEAEVKWREALGIDRPRVPLKSMSPRIGLLVVIDQAQDFGRDPAIDPERQLAIKPGSIAPEPTVAVGLVAAREGAEVKWREAVGIDRPRVPHKGMSPRIGLLVEIDQAQEIGPDPTIDRVPAIDPERQLAIKPGSIAPEPKSAINPESIAPVLESAINLASIAPEPESAINPGSTDDPELESAINLESIVPEPESAINPGSTDDPELESAINLESIVPEPESAINRVSTDDPEQESAINLESTALEPASAIDPESTIDPVLAMDRIIGRTSTTTGITATGTGTGRKGVEVGTSIRGRPGGSRQRQLASHLGGLARSFTTRATAPMPIHTTCRTRQSRPIR